MAAMSGNDSDVWVSALPSITIGGTPETCNNIDSGTWIKYQAAVHKYWDRNAVLTVQCSPNGSTGWATATDYTFDWIGGIVTFNTARVSGTNNFVRIQAGFYFNVSQVAQCGSWELDMKTNVVTTDVFQGSGWGSSQASMKSATGKVGSFIPDSTLATQLANLLVFILYTTKTVGSRFECYGFLTGVAPKSSMAGVVEQEVGFVVDGQVYYRAT